MKTKIDVTSRTEDNIEYWTYDIHIHIDNEKAIATSIVEALKSITSLFEKLEATLPDVCESTAKGICHAASESEKYFSVDQLLL